LPWYGWRVAGHFDFAAVPSVSKAQVMALAKGHEWLKHSANVLLVSPAGVGKSHLVPTKSPTKRSWKAWDFGGCSDTTCRVCQVHFLYETDKKRPSLGRSGMF
jgi:hypothetical protein